MSTNHMSALATETTDDVIGADNVRLRVWQSGRGMPVVLLHGFPEDHRAWGHQFAPLAEAGFAVFTSDLRGYGASERPKGVKAYRLQNLVGDVAAIALAAGSPIHLVGHDWGGVIAWAFAARHPELLGRLVILNAPHPQLYLRSMWRSSQLFKSWYALVFQVPWLPERVLAANDFRLLRMMYRLGTSHRSAFTDREVEDYLSSFRERGALTAALNYYRANVRAPSRFTKSRIETQTLVIWGERDPALSLSLLDGLEDVAPNVTVHRLPEAGHFVQREAPAAVNRLLLEFLRV